MKRQRHSLAGRILQGGVGHVGHVGDATSLYYSEVLSRLDRIRNLIYAYTGYSFDLGVVNSILEISESTTKRQVDIHYLRWLTAIRRNMRDGGYEELLDKILIIEALKLDEDNAEIPF